MQPLATSDDPASGDARLMLVADMALPEENLEDFRELCRSFGAFMGEPVTLARVRDFGEARAAVAGSAGAIVETINPAPPRNAAMSSADFIYKEDGTPDWSAMWTGFCELALFGGPPHRGADNPVAAVVEAEAAPDIDAIAEIRRGIWETTGLFSEPASPGWLAISCDSTRMAAWMCASIIIENVEARFDEDRLLVPASPSFTLKNEVKSVITVVAKVHHYYLAHVLTQG